MTVLCGLALGGAGCGELPDVTTVKDLRVLAVKCEPAGFLVDLEKPGSLPASAYSAQITALVADPLAPDGMLTITAAGCPDYIDTITSATGQGTKLCPPPSAVSQLPEPLRTDLTTVNFIPPDTPLVVPATPGMNFVFQPTVSFGLTPQQVKDFFTISGNPALDQSIQYNRDFGLPAIVNLNFDTNGEHAVAIKNVVYWPKLDANEPVNTNPTLAGLIFYKHRNVDTGDPEDPWPDPNPTVSISAGDKLYVQPDYLPHDGYPGAADLNYLLNVKNTQTNAIELKVVPTELIRFQFYATAGTFSPDEQQSELEPFLAPGSRLHTDSEYNLPKASEVPADGQLEVRIWVVTRDERAGSDWFSTTITVVP